MLNYIFVLEQNRSGDLNSTSIEPLAIEDCK
jgi:hypothetical protein